MKNQSEVFLIFILGALMSFAALSTDFYLPAMPVMSVDLGGRAELSITGFLIGFSLGQLFWGAISDKIGRKKPLFIGLVLFILGTIGCAMSQNIVQMVFWRVIQAFGACVAPVVARAVVRDLFDSVKAAQMFSTLLALMAIVPTLCPLLGGQVLKYGSWHDIFWIIALIGVVVLVASFFLKESLLPQKRSKISLSRTFGRYGLLVSNFTFMKYALTLCFFYMSLYAFIAASPFVYIEYFGVAKENYGFLFAINIIGLMCVSAVNRTLVKKFSLQKLLKIAILVMLISSLFLVIFAFFEILGLFGIAVCVFFIYATNGVIATSCIILALNKTKHMAGSASAVIGFLQYGSGVVSSVILAIIGSNSPLTMSIVMCIFAIFASVTTFVNFKKRKFLMKG